MFADWMDRKYVDPLLGLFLPGLGDAAGSVMGLYAIVVAWRLRLHPVVMARMLINLGVDALLGAIPLLGWLLDFFYKAHVRNLSLLQSRSTSTKQSTVGDWLVVLLAAVFFLVALIAPLVATAFALTWLAQRV